MQSKRLFIISMLLVVSLLGSTTSLAQNSSTETPTPTFIPTPTFTITPPPVSGNDVAILVIDVFEQSNLVHEVNVSELPPDGIECAISIDGQDGAAFRGNSAISSSLHPFNVTHGRMVFNQIETDLNSRYPATVPLPNSTSMPPVLESWQTPRGKIWLMAVDTQNYAADQIAAQTLNAVNLLSSIGVHRFVLNMSFALIPCQNYPQLTRQVYLQQLDAWGVECTEEAGLPEIACTLSESSDEGFAIDLIRIREAGGASSVAFAYLHLAVMRPLLITALQSSFPTPPIAESPNFLALLNQLPNSETYIQVAAAGNDDLGFPYYPAIAENVLSVKADYNVSSCRQGNENDIMIYLRDEIKIPEQAAIELAADLGNPGIRKSNSGEVSEDGNAEALVEQYLKLPPSGADVLGCVYGSSFAAPRVSVLMAIDQQVRGTTECAAPQPLGTVFDPPLAYKQWDSLDIPTAAATYCDDFPL